MWFDKFDDARVTNDDGFHGCDVNVTDIGDVCKVLFSTDGLKLPRLEKRELVFLLSITHNFVVAVRLRFLFLCVLLNSFVILLWHSLGLL